ncbi:CDP-alcohol phosphatidyltransferase family protein [soil metagenome]
MTIIPSDLGPVQTIGTNATPIWGMTNAERIRRMATEAAKAGKHVADGHVLVANLTYVFDPLLLNLALEKPGTTFTMGEDLVLGQLPRSADPAAVRTAGVPITDLSLGGKIYNNQLRKLEVPFVQKLDAGSRHAIERQSYFGAYKGVTDILTKYLWPEWALVLTRLAARIGMTPNMVTGIGAILCVLATVAFWYGHYWSGMAMGLVFMVLDTVDGKLARCTITSSKWGNVFDHGIDLVHPPFWWVAWAVGLAAYGRPLPGDLLTASLAVIVVGYVVQRLIEGAFLRLYKMHIHVWEKVDSDFRLITARRNPNMVILFFATLVGRPDAGLVAVAIWTLLSLLFHAVRLVQAMVQARRGPILSWLKQG